MKKAIFPGSFDPFHLGHKAIYDKAIDLFDEVIVYITWNDKKTGQSKLEDRKKQVLSIIPKASIVTGAKLTVDIAMEQGALYIVRGIRDKEDYMHEHELASYNKTLNRKVQTIFIIADEHLRNITSSEIKKVLKN